MTTTTTYTSSTCSSASSATATPPYTSHTRHLLSDSTPPRWPSSRRSNSSYHSHSSKSALSEQPPTAATTTTTAAASKQIGIPFLWEDLPGIPKKQTLHKRSTSRYPTSNYSALPLPPARPSKNADRRGHDGGGSAVHRDPFLTALLECSKDGGKLKAVKKVSETGDHQRMGIMGTLVSSYEMSCKRVCGVSDSIVLLPGSARRRPYRYDLFNNASSG